MIIDIQQHIDTLRRQHGIITVAVCSLSDSTPLNTPAGITAIATKNDRMTYVVTHSDADRLATFLAQHNITPGWWVQLREYDEYIPKHRPLELDEINGDLSEVRMGALDQMFGYIAVQVKRLEHLDEVFERVQLELADGRQACSM